MPFTNFLGTPISTVGSIDLGQGGTNSPWPSVFQFPQMSITINGSAFVPTSSLQLLGATITYGLDVGVSSATIEMTATPNISEYSVIKIYADALPTASPTLRFTGLFLRVEANLWPHTYSLICKGMLYLAQQYQQPYYVGQSPTIIAEISAALPVGRPMVTYTTSDGIVYQGLIGTIQATDQQIVRAILRSVTPALTFADSDIKGTGKLFGLFSAKEMFWPPYKTAMEQVQMFDQVSLGYRLYESLGGIIRRDQIYGYPSTTIDTTFTEGIDIWEGRGTRTVEQLCNSSYVEGATLDFLSSTGGSERLIWAFVQSSNPFQPSTALGTVGWNPVSDQFRSPLIETSALLIGAGVNVNGLSADDVANWRLSERNRELVHTSFVTFRDTILFPGRTIGVLAPHMAITEPQWLQRVEVRIQAQPALFQQTLTTIGGGISGAYTPPLP